MSGSQKKKEKKKKENEKKQTARQLEPVVQHFLVAHVEVATTVYFLELDTSVLYAIIYVVLRIIIILHRSSDNESAMNVCWSVQ